MPFISSDEQYHGVGWYQYGTMAHPVMDFPNIDNRIMDTLLATLESALSNYQKVILIRLDFHMAQFTSQNQSIQRLFQQLKSAIKKHYASNCYYVWVRERTSIAKTQHYHTMVALSGHSCRNSWKVFTFAKSIWHRLTGTSSCYHPDNPYYALSRNEDDCYVDTLRACIYRLSYLAKDITKEDGIKRRFGSSSANQRFTFRFSINQYFSSQPT